MSGPEVVIVGGGLAGLSCGVRLREIGLPFRIVEAGDAVGGRVRTDRVEGFQLDRGFQVLLTAYPECQRMLDYAALDLQPFVPGALIRCQNRFERFVDPSRRPWEGLKSLFSPIGTPRDKWRLLALRSKILKGSLADQFQKPEGLTLDLLRWGGGLSDAMIDRFFRPFFGGIFLERDLVTSSRLFRFVLRMFATGETAVPARGMAAIPEQIAADLPADAIVLHRRVTRVEPGRVECADGAVMTARAVVIATDAPAARALLGERVVVKSRGTCCLYYAAERSPVGEPILVLNADDPGPVNHLAVMSDVAPSYAPPGAALVSASVVGVPGIADEELDAQARRQLAGWYGSAVSGWKLLRIDRIPDALPDQSAPALDPVEKDPRIAPGLFACGDRLDTASINGALASGWRAAQAVAAELHAAAS